MPTSHSDTSLWFFWSSYPVKKLAKCLHVLSLSHSLPSMPPMADLLFIAISQTCYSSLSFAVRNFAVEVRKVANACFSFLVFVFFYRCI